MHKPITLLTIILVLAIAPAAVLAKTKTQPPNILFVIMDDVGIDQMELFGYGGVGSGDDGRTPQLPNIATIAGEGIAFRNTWSMPACSTSRAVFFTGRYPLRTHVLGALGPDDLANAQVSPYEISLPTLLKQRGYASALFGKFHLGLQGKNPFKDSMPSVLGWDYFYGWLDETGDPHSIDTTAGLGDPGSAPGNYSCGFVPGYDPESPEGMYGADFGACYNARGQCNNLSTSGGIPPGRACRDGGGILQPGASCQHPVPANIKAGFQNLSAHYVSPLVINTKNGKVEEVPPTDIRARTFRGSAPVDGAIEWIKHQPNSQPWMASISFASAHTPAMQPPQALINTDPAATSALSCATPKPTDDQDQTDALNLAQRELTTELIEALDTELARLLVSIGIATYNPDKSLNYSAGKNKNTMIVILGDNGSLGNVVKEPFDQTRAKGTAYQTGVWVPLVIAGPLVKGTDRKVEHMVNVADLYQLFGEIAGIEDVHAAVPRQLDSESMMPYLTNDDHVDSIRTSNFTQVGINVQADGALYGPCTIGNSCTQIPVSKSVCMDNGGTWYGEGTDVALPDGPLQYCCQVNQYLYDQAIAAVGTPTCDPDSPAYEPKVCEPLYFELQPLESVAVRNDFFKVVQNTYRGDPDPNPFDAAVQPSCDALPPGNEFYAIDELPDDPQLDKDGEDLLLIYDPLPSDLQVIYDQLSGILTDTLNSETPCPAENKNNGLWTFDGNLDGVIDEQDLEDLTSFAELADGGSSWYDVNFDGYTKVDGDPDENDYALVQAKLGTNCPPE